MKYLSVFLRTNSPLTIRADHAPSGAVSMSYIPGTTFSGGLASLYKLLYHEDAKMMEAFTPLFLQEQVLYSNLYPATFDDSGFQGTETPVYPLPKTAQSCKRHGGFLLPDDKKNDGHGVRDTLIDWALFKLGSSNPGLQRAVFQRNKNCIRCGQEMDHIDCYYRRDDISPKRMMAANVGEYIRVQTHTGIDRESGTVQENILYNRQVFAEGMQFWGQISFPDDEYLLIMFQNFISEVGNSGMLHLGTGRTRGMGKVTLEVKGSESEQKTFDSFKQRLNKFNELLHLQADERGFGPLQAYFFALTLHSPLILCDDLLRYQGSIDTTILEKLLGLRSKLIRIYYAADVQRVTGWQELWGTPRTNDYAIETGSVFLFSYPSQPDQAILEGLFAMEEQGLGKRRAEGFGQICISDQFHQHVHQEG